MRIRVQLDSAEKCMETRRKSQIPTNDKNKYKKDYNNKHKMRASYPL
jgi:hypothetical protein